MNDRSFDLAILGILGAVLLAGIVLVMNTHPAVGKAIAMPPVQVPVAQPVQAAPPQGVLCADAGSCRTKALCSPTSDGLITDGVGMGCISADSAHDQGITYCAHMTRTQGNDACSYKDNNPRCVCA